MKTKYQVVKNNSQKLERIIKQMKIKLDILFTLYRRDGLGVETNKLKKSPLYLLDVSFPSIMVLPSRIRTF